MSSRINLMNAAGGWPVLALTLAAAAGLHAQDEFFFDDEELDEIAETELFDSTVEVGAAYQSDGARHFGRDAGLDGKGFSPVIDFRARAPPDWNGESAHFWRAEGYRLGWDSRRLEIATGRQGTQKFEFSWRELPNRQIEGGRTPFIGPGSGFFSLPPGWVVTGDATAGMLALHDDLRTVNTGTQRERLDLGYWRSFRDRWRFDVDYRHETKEGSRVAGAIFGFTGGNPRAALLPVPVDQTTRIMDATVEYGGDRYLVGGAYHGSYFENDRPSISWQNPFGQHSQWAPGTGFPDGAGRLSQFPDNRFHQLRTYGAWHFGSRTQFNADLAFGRLEQDEDFLTYTVNPNIDIEAPLPRDSLDGEIRTTLLNLRLATRPADRLNLVFSYRFDDRENKTPQDAFRLVGADSEQQRSPEEARINLPYSLRKQALKGDATWRFARRSRLVGGLRYQVEERDDFSEAADLDEWGAWAGLRGAFGARISYRVDLDYADRKYDEYDGRAPFVAGHVPGTTGPDDFENIPDLRKFNMADRRRGQIRARLDFQPLDVVSFALAYRYSKDDYDDERFGLDDATVRSVTADFGYFPNEHLSLSGFFSHDRFETAQSARSFASPVQSLDPDRNWSAAHDDRADTAGMSIQLVDISKRIGALSRAGLNRQLDIGADFLFTRTRGKIDVAAGPAFDAAPLPDTVNRLNAYKLWVRYQITTQWHTRFGVEHERFDSQNFALDNVEIDTLANVLTLGQPSPGYNVTWIVFSLGYSF